MPLDLNAPPNQEPRKGTKAYKRRQLVQPTPGAHGHANIEPSPRMLRAESGLDNDAWRKRMTRHTWHRCDDYGNSFKGAAKTRFCFDCRNAFKPERKAKRTSDNMEVLAAMLNVAARKKAMKGK